jgi:hypothetical protein
MTFIFLDPIYDGTLIDSPVGLYLVFSGWILIGLMVDPRYMVGLVIFDRLLGWEPKYQEWYTDD